MPRGRLDIGWSDLAHAVAVGPRPGPRPELARRLRTHLPDPPRTLVTLSVRSGFDLLLHALALPRGSEVLLSALTIRDMARIVTAHGLVPVPVDLDMDRLALDPEALQRATGPRARVLVVAHLFGSRMPLGRVREFCTARGLLLVEDCAQSFTGLDTTGDPRSDVVMMSFGLIKTHTCLGGAVLVVRSPDLRERMRRIQHAWPLQPDREVRVRALRAAGVQALLTPACYGSVVGLAGLLGWNHDARLSNSLRGFPGAGFFERIRRRPSGALLALMAHRFERFDPARLRRRADAASALLQRIPHLSVPGRSASDHTHWLVPVCVPEPEVRMRALWRDGFDATRGATSLAPVPSPPGFGHVRTPNVSRCMGEILFLPAPLGASRSRLDTLVAHLAAWPAHRAPAQRACG
ncbi:MAG: DegT/DnrJ/EryC1/StrS family aminotransferase [Gemmatimonadota bacterium]